ncbi:MAG: hypothetical protein SynsKO_29560 [Synoicihabitans sp.]
MFAGRDLECLQSLVLPDRWQAEAIHALNDGRDVVLDAPTGAGKTYVFERWVEQHNFSRRAIFAVPTRALANDKFAEWRARDWRVGIITGDLTIDADAPVIVATLEAVQSRLVDAPRRHVPRHRRTAEGHFQLLAVDEYQWLSDPSRGNHYEGVLGHLDPDMQLLLLSGSVANPHAVATWLQRLQRDVAIVQTAERPVPLEEFDIDDCIKGLPRTITGFWAKRLAGALREGLGPTLVFAPHRKDAERLARQFARELPLADPLTLTPAQKQAAGPALARLLQQRMAFHHSGLSYAQRAGLIEPLAKAGQLRAVVGTLGLSAGINFSLRSVMVTAGSYFVDRIEREIAPHDFLQMIGRAGRRGLDDTGYVLVSGRTPRMRMAAPQQLKRAAPLPWPFLLRGLQPGDAVREAVGDSAARFFTKAPARLGDEETAPLIAREGELPCHQLTDTGRARVVRRRRNPAKVCRTCPWRETCRSLSPEPTLLWQLQRIGVLDRSLRVTARGAIAGAFLGPEGLALAVALEDRRYPLDQLIYDGANLFAGDRFTETNPRRLGRLAAVGEKAYRRFDFEGWLVEGVPPGYGYGASDVVQAIMQRTAKAGVLAAESEYAGRGDIDRLMTEWRSWLRQVATAPPLDNVSERELPLAQRWDDFRALAAVTLGERDEDTLPDLPRLTAEQRRPYHHRLGRVKR